MFDVKTQDALLITGGRVIDPARKRDAIADVAVVNGIIADEAPEGSFVINAAGWIVCPGLMDLHVHLREPGQTHKETVETGTAAAAAGGFTFVACMPNTRPPIDQPGSVRYLRHRGRQANYCDVGPIAAITQGRAGARLTDFAALLDAGAVAFSDDGDGVEDDVVMRTALEHARDLSAVIIQHCEYKALSAGGVMHLGEVCRRAGLPGLDPRSEEAMIERDLELCRAAGGRYHVAHISTARAVELVKQAKAEALPVTAEVCVHHLVLTEAACAGADPNTKIHPPLRTEADVEACRRGLLDGTIDCIVTDHAPHAVEEKAVGFLRAPPGVVGLETAVPLIHHAMIESGLADWRQVIAWLTTGPAAVLGRGRKAIDPGALADLTLIDPAVRWTVEPQRFLTKGRNTPFTGWTLTSLARGTVRGRQVILVRRPEDETGAPSSSIARNVEKRGA